MAPSPPIVKAFLVCDHVIHEAETNKKSLIGVFHQIGSQGFPCRHGQLSIYANFLNAEGEYVFRLSLVNLKSGKEIGRGGTAPIRVEDRLQTAELAFRLQNIVFPEPGKYEFGLYANEDQIARKDIEVRMVGGRGRG